MITDIIRKLRTEVKQVGERVYGIIDLEKLLSEVNVENFTLYVSHVSDTPTANEGVSRDINRLRHDFVVFAALPIKSQDYRGEAALQFLWDFRYEMMRALWGFKNDQSVPDQNESNLVVPRTCCSYKKMSYEGSQFVRIHNSVAIWAYEFSWEEDIALYCLKQAEAKNYEIHYWPVLKDCQNDDHN